MNKLLGLMGFLLIVGAPDSAFAIDALKLDLNLLTCQSQGREKYYMVNSKDWEELKSERTKVISGARVSGRRTSSNRFEVRSVTKISNDRYMFSYNQGGFRGDSFSFNLVDSHQVIQVKQVYDGDSVRYNYVMDCKLNPDLED
jgi:hypothetical protein